MTFRPLIFCLRRPRPLSIWNVQSTRNGGTCRGLYLKPVVKPFFGHRRKAPPSIQSHQIDASLWVKFISVGICNPPLPCLGSSLRFAHFWLCLRLTCFVSQYAVIVFPLQAPGFKASEREPLLRQVVEITTRYAAGPRQKTYTSATYETRNAVVDYYYRVNSLSAAAASGFS
jgi:hypothetical protein